MRLYVQNTLPDIFFCFHIHKEGRRGKILKGKVQYVKGKLRKDAEKRHFIFARKDNSQLMLQWPFLS